MTPTRPSAGHGVSPLNLFRTDLAGRAATPFDDQAIGLAAMLRHAAAFPDTSRGRRTLAMARRIARRMLSAADIREGVGADEARHRTRFHVLRVAADRTMRAHGRVTLAANMLDSLAALVPLESMEGGRLLSQRAAALWHLGHLDVATQQYRQLMRLGQKLGSRELVARGFLGSASRSLVVGNLPKAERLMRQVVKLTTPEVPRVMATALHHLAIVRAMRGGHGEALELLWRSYRIARSHRQLRAAALHNISNVLLKTGYPEAARAAAKYLLCSPILHFQQFAVLGMYANASAALGDVAAVDWSVERLLELAETPSFTMYVADALFECSLALEQVGRVGKANRLRKRAHAMAVRHGYNEIAFSADHAARVSAPSAPTTISKAAQAVVAEVFALEPEDAELLEVHAG